jgi:hypothetical protein
MEEKQYNDNKNITLKKKGGRPKGSKNKPKPTPTPVPPTEQEVLEEWVKNNRPFFFNYGRKNREDLEKVYRLYNILFNSNKKIVKTGCGGCHLNIIREIAKRYF